jgi:hypothetical protein
MMQDLGTLVGGGGSCGQWINDNGVVVGGSHPRPLVLGKGG